MKRITTTIIINFTHLLLPPPILCKGRGLSSFTRAERVRFAPSPTGILHLGSLRTALFNYLLAHKTGGQFILRIEDTDKSRTIPGASSSIIDTLEWCGISFDEGPGKASTCGPFIQSERLEIYQNCIKHLLEVGKAYRCYCSRERIESLRLADGYGRYDGHCRNIPLSTHENLTREGGSSTSSVIRFRVPPGTVTVSDLVYGKSSIPNRLVDDVVLLKSDGFPTYHFANVVDDHYMRITTVLRGQEWLPSTGLHILLYQAFGWEAPSFAHLPLLVNPDGSKLSKRQNDAFVDYYRDAGYFPQALINFVAFLGWTPRNDSEVMSLEQLCDKFDLRQINRADALVDIQKLDWLNRQHLQVISKDPIGSTRLANELLELMPKSKVPPSGEEDHVKRCIQLMVTFLKDIPLSAAYLFERPEYTPKLLALIGDIPVAIKSTRALQVELGEGAFVENSSVDAIFRKVANAIGLESSKVMKTFRIALTGSTVGPSIEKVFLILGRLESLERINLFLAYLYNTASPKEDKVMSPL